MNTFRPGRHVAVALAFAALLSGPAFAGDEDGVSFRWVSDDESGRGWLGIHIQDLTPSLSEALEVDAEGVLISSVGNGSPAEEAGLMAQDVIVSVEGGAIEDADRLLQELSRFHPGDRVHLEVLRDGATEKVEVTLGDRPPEARDTAAPEAPGLLPLDPMIAFGGGPRLGVEIQEPNEDLASYFGISKGEGVLVTGVLDGSPAAKADLRSGDVILEVDGRRVSNLEALREGLSRAEEGKVELKVKRKGDDRTVTVDIGEGPSIRAFRNGFKEAPGMRRFHREAPEVFGFRGPDGAPMSSEETREQMMELRNELRELRRNLQDEADEGMRGLKEEMEGLRDELREMKRELQEAR